MFSLSDYIAFLAIILIGLPHGAFDAAMASALTKRQNTKVSSIPFLPIFFSAYLAAAATVIAVWQIAPVLSLAGFLAISLVHFGLGDRHAISERAAHSPRFAQFLSALLIFCHGGIVTLALPFFHHAETAYLFSLLSGAASSQLIDIIRLIFPLWAAASVFYVILAFSLPGLRRFCAELAVLTCVVYILSPLVGFAVYFCCVHSARHFRSLYESLTPLLPAPQLIMMGTALTLLSWAGFLAAYLVATYQFELGIERAVMHIVFVGLAALTVPHMILVDMMFRPELGAKGRS